MDDKEERLRDNFKTVYKVSHKSKHGFHGNSTIWVAVEEETDEEIIGRNYGPMQRGDLPGSKVTIRKDNVAGWKEVEWHYKTIPTEVPTPDLDKIKRDYLMDNIDEEELEKQVEEAL